MTEDQGIQAFVSTSIAALILVAIAAAWIFGLRRLGARWALRWVALAATLVFVVVEIVLWSDPRPNVGPAVMLWAAVAMPLLLTTTFTLLPLLALTLAVALAGVVRIARGRGAS